MVILREFSYNIGGDIMIKYPNGHKKTSISRKKSANKANLGMSLEDDLNKTNKYYRDLNIALVYKKPVPIRVVNVNYPKRSKAEITKAFYTTPSTTDYNGIYKGLAIDFEAKQTSSKTAFAFNLIARHQIDHLKRVIDHGGIAFVIVRFSSFEETYFTKAEKIIKLYDGKRRSLPYKWFKKEAHLIPFSLSPPIDYIKVIDKLFFKEK